MMRNIARFLTICTFIIPSGFVPGADSAEKPSLSREKGYHFFVGANLRILHEESYFPVERIWNARAQIKVNDEIISERVSRLKELKVDRQAKISPHFAQISDLKCEPVYSVGRDPKTIAAKQQATAESLASSFSDQVDSGYRQSANPNAFNHMPKMGLSSSAFGGPKSESGGGSGEGDQESGEGSGDGDQELAMMMQTAQLELLEGLAMDFIDATDPGDVDTSTSRPMWDMLRVRFSISSDKYYPSGHLVFIFQLTDTPEGEPVMSWFHFLSLKEISPEGKSYDYRLADYPDGMYIASQEAFLFTNGTEIATNLSSKHVGMSEKDARVFLKYQYLTANSGKTRPPDRAWKYLDPPLRYRVKPDIRDQSITLKIDQEGQVQEILTSPDVQAALNPMGMQEIASLIYLPALEEGKPVPGELVLTLRDLVLD